MSQLESGNEFYYQYHMKALEIAEIIDNFDCLLIIILKNLERSFKQLDKKLNTSDVINMYKEVN